MGIYTTHAAPPPPQSATPTARSPTPGYFSLPPPPPQLGRVSLQWGSATERNRVDSRVKAVRSQPWRRGRGGREKKPARFRRGAAAGEQAAQPAFRNRNSLRLPAPFRSDSGAALSPFTSSSFPRKGKKHNKKGTPFTKWDCQSRLPHQCPLPSLWRGERHSDLDCSKRTDGDTSQRQLHPECSPRPPLHRL